MHCRNKIVLLAGATGGIGQAIAQELDRAGARLILVGRNADRLQTLQDSLSGQHCAFAADINDAGQRDRIFEQCARDGLDIFVNAAGVMDFRLFDLQDSVAIEAMVTRETTRKPAMSLPRIILSR